MPYGWLLRDLSDSAIVYLLAVAVVVVGFMLAAALVCVADILHHWSDHA